MPFATRCYLLIVLFACLSTAADSILQQNHDGSSSAQAAPTTEPVTHPTAELVAAPRVVAIEGVVQHTRSRWVAESELIVTDVTMDVHKASNPQLVGKLTFTAPGGELVERNLRMTINTIPVFRVGQQHAVSLDSPLDDQPGNYRYRTHLRFGATQ